MASPTVRASNVWQTEAADDMLQISNPRGPVISGIDSTGAGFGALAGGGIPAGSAGDVQFNSGTVFANAETVADGSTVNLDSNGNLHITLPGMFDVTSTGDAINFHAPSDITISSTSGNVNLNAASPNRHVSILADGFQCQTLDLDITFDSSNNPSNINFTAGGASIIFDATHTNMVGLQVFANNAAAIAGGLHQYDLYRTGANPDVVCIVH
jgi:hypothetical protein